MRQLLGGQTLFGLVNNAGAAFHGPLMYQPIAEVRRNIEINVIGTLIVTQVTSTLCCKEKFQYQSVPGMIGLRMMVDARQLGWDWQAVLPLHISICKPQGSLTSGPETITK